MELKNSQWTESTHHTDNAQTCLEELQKSKKRKIMSSQNMSMDGSKQPKTLLLPDYSQAEVKFVVEYVSRKEVNLCRFLTILNSLESQLNGTVEKYQETTTPITKLPNELLIKILSYLSTQDLRDNMENVSKQFKELCKSPLVHLVVTIKSYENEANFLRGATMMTELYLHTIDEKDCQEELMAITNHCHLRVLHVYGCIILDPPSFYSLGSSKWWKNLREFHMGLANESYDELGYLSDFDSVISKLGFYGNMTHFGFGCYDEDYMCDDIHQVAVLNLIKGPSMKNLKSLVVCESYSESQLTEIFEARKETLEELDINCSCSNFDFVYLCHKIKHLAINETMYLNLDILPKFKNLTSLQIFLTEDYDEEELLQINNDLPPGSLPSLTSLKMLVDTSTAEVKFIP